MNNQTQNIEQINERLQELEKNITISQILTLIEQLCSEGEIGEESLLQFLINRRTISKKKIVLLDGLIFDKLYKTEYINITKKLNYYFNTGIVSLNQNLKLNYQPLQDLLINKNFKEADKLTQKYLCQLAGLDKSNKRQWLYFTDIQIIPGEDLLIIDLLWQLYSQGKFGFSIQRQIWINKEGKWNDFWKTIGWTRENVPCRYPNDFTWTINAPKGHLPLFNQLRGMQVLASLFNHIVWQHKNCE
uniref:GUN4-like domain-containing protein n=1 Tax=Centroceras clavulatum TaxID=159503 RepID=A0A4D6WN97_9FLOR|nr:hypothetical protein [Centroceras clavulatum]